MLSADWLGWSPLTVPNGRRACGHLLVLLVACRTPQSLSGPLGPYAAKLVWGRGTLACVVAPIAVSAHAPFPIRLCTPAPDSSVGLFLSTRDTVWGVLVGATTGNTAQGIRYVDSIAADVRTTFRAHAVLDCDLGSTPPLSGLWATEWGHIALWRRPGESGRLGLFLGTPPCLSVR